MTVQPIFTLRELKIIHKLIEGVDIHQTQDDLSL